MGVGDQVPQAIEQLGAQVDLIDAEHAGLGRSVAVQRDRHRRARLRAPPGSCARTTSACCSTPRTAARCSCSTTSSSSTRRSTDRIRRRSAPTASPTRTRRSRSSCRITRSSSTPNRIGPETWARLGAGAGHVFSGAARPALRRSRPNRRIRSRTMPAQDRRAGRGARRQGAVDLHRARPLAAAARRHRRRVPPDGQPAQPGTDGSVKFSPTTSASSSTRTSKTPRRSSSSR